jgi:translation elongation factor EF-1alpha
MGLSNGPDQEEKKLLINLAYDANQPDYIPTIQGITTYKEYEALWYEIENLLPGIDQIQNPKDEQINKHFKRFI